MMCWAGLIRYCRNMSIQGKLILLAVTTAATALFVASAMFIIHDVRAMRESTAREMGAVADVLAANTVAALAFDDRLTAEEVLSSSRCDPRIETVTVFDHQGNLFATYRGKGIPAGKHQLLTRVEGHWPQPDGSLGVSRVISDGDQTVGFLHLCASLDHAKAHLRTHAAMVASVFVLALAVAALMGVRLQKAVSLPIRELARTVGQISEKQDFSVRVTKWSEDEIGELYDAFNDMLSHIDAGRRALKQSHDELEVRVAERTRQFSEAIDKLQREIAERERAEQKLRMLQEQHLEAARQAGMAEIATSVLHNVGNVLNSVNVSSNLLADSVHRFGVADLARVADLLEQHRDNLGAYVTEDERGRHLASFLIELARHMNQVERLILEELDSLLKYVDHIKDIIAVQQTNARSVGFVETVSLKSVVDDALRINMASIERHEIKVVCDIQDLPPITIDKRKLLQVLINLISNARKALRDTPHAARRIVVRAMQCESDPIHIQVQDNGMGIAAENLRKIFSHGFTTRSDGHGFGLHIAALHAKELGGRLTVHSDGLGTGATFTLEIPFDLAEAEIVPSSEECLV